MEIYDLETAFGGQDITTEPMRAAISDWFSAYYEQPETPEADPSQRVAYTVVGKLLKTVFGEYTATVKGDFCKAAVRSLDHIRMEAVQLALVGGEVYLKPVLEGGKPFFITVPRDRILIFGRGIDGEPTDVGCAAKSRRGRYYYTLLERRSMDTKGYLTVTNRLYRSTNPQTLGVEVPLSSYESYADLPARYTYEEPVGSVGLVRMCTPMLNCVDGSPDGVSVYAAAMGLIRAINENEAQLQGEFRRGQSRIVVSRDMLDRDKKLKDHLFVGLDEDPEHVGITIFSPQLREQSYIARKQEYLRNVESLVGLKRGMLSDAAEQQRTATEISSSAGDFNLTVIDFQRMWEKTLGQALTLICLLGRLYGLTAEKAGAVTVDWGNGVLYDEDVQWEAYRQMVADGLLKPEVALGWRFNMPIDTPEQLEAIRSRYMPDQSISGKEQTDG